jgi:hypothetical protein
MINYQFRLWRLVDVVPWKITALRWQQPERSRPRHSDDGH